MGNLPRPRSRVATTAVMLQPLACVRYAVEQLGDVSGQTVGVICQGPIGLAVRSSTSSSPTTRSTRWT